MTWILSVSGRVISEANARDWVSLGGDQETGIIFNLH